MTIGITASNCAPRAKLFLSFADGADCDGGGRRRWHSVPVHAGLQGRISVYQLADRGSECPAVAERDRVKDFLNLVLYHNGLVWSGAGVGSAWHAIGFGLRVRRCRQRDTHGYPPNTDLLLMTIGRATPPMEAC